MPVSRENAACFSTAGGMVRWLRDSQDKICNEVLSEGTGWITARMSKNDKDVLVSTKVLADDSIPAGHGFWYRSVGTSVPTVTWNDLNDL